MKRRSMVITVIVIFSIATGVIFIINRYRNKKWNDSYHYINEIPKTREYEVKPVVQKELVFEWGYAPDKGVREYYTDTYYKDKEGVIYTSKYANGSHATAEYIFFDTLTKTVWIKTTERVADHQYTREEILNIDLDGNIIERIEDRDKSSAALEGLLVLNSDTLDVKKSSFYVAHFIRQEFRWRSLDPFRNIGNPTGGGAPIYWDVIAFLTIELKNSHLTFKTNTTTSNNGEYSLSTVLYRVPKKYTEGKEVIFLYIGSEYAIKKDKGLYLIKDVQ